MGSNPTGPIIINVKVIPNAKSEAFIKKDDHFVLKIKEKPIKGKANNAIIMFFKKKGINAKILKGATSRLKIIALERNKNSEELIK